jgi:acyl-CoA thioester hydrolase
MKQIFRYELNVSDDTIDENGHVNNVEYLRWMLDAAVMHSGILGCTAAIKEIGATWVVRTHHITYLLPAFAGEKIVVLTWVSNLRRVLSLRKYKVVRMADKAVLAEGETDWVFVHAETGKLRFMPKDIMALFEVLPQEKEAEVMKHVLG